MKNPILALTLSAILGAGTVTLIARGQDAPPPQGEGGGGHGRRQFDPQQRVNMLAKRLNLTDDQKTKVQSIFADMQQQSQGIRQDSSLSREDKMAKMKALREDADGKINGVL